MKTTRYFEYQQAIWKFEHGKTPQIRTKMTLDWTDSAFASLDEFLSDPDLSLEITEEDAEADFLVRT